MFKIVESDKMKIVFNLFLGTLLILVATYMLFQEYGLVFLTVFLVISGNVLYIKNGFNTKLIDDFDKYILAPFGSIVLIWAIFTAIY